MTIIWDIPGLKVGSTQYECRVCVVEELYNLRNEINDVLSRSIRLHREAYSASGLCVSRSVGKIL